MFNRLEDYENYFGMERNLNDEETDFTETVREYYDRGGELKIPDKYPAVIFFDLAMSGIDIYDHWGLEWVYIGDENVHRG